MELTDDFREFVGLLNEHGVKYLVVGGYAVNFHGIPRYTKDIDFWLWMTESNIEKLLDALRAFGMGSLNLKMGDFLNPEDVVQLGYAPNRIDLLVDVTGVDFETCFEQRMEKDVNGTIVNFLSLSDLITAKKEAGRPQDLADVDQLEKLRKEEENGRK